MMSLLPISKQAISSLPKMKDNFLQFRPEQVLEK